MKVIDLLNKIANGEKAPKIIEYQGTEYIFDEDDYKTYKGANLLDDACLTRYIVSSMLNDEVEIIEDEFIDIEEFKEHQIFNTRDILELQMFINKRNADYDCKINDLIKNQKKIIEKLKDSE